MMIANDLLAPVAWEAAVQGSLVAMTARRPDDQDDVGTARRDKRCITSAPGGESRRADAA
jgi:hypothetical protein